MAAGIPESLLADAIGPQGLPRTYALLLAALSLVDRQIADGPAEAGHCG